jgi:hypothetical protein
MFANTHSITNVIKLFCSSLTLLRKARVFVLAMCFPHTLLSVYESVDYRKKCDEKEEKDFEGSTDAFQ